MSLSQPLRVERGRAQFAIPSGRTKAGEVVRERITLGVEPEGRQIDLALHWKRPTGFGTYRLGTKLSREPGHREDADAEVILLSSWELTF